MGRHCKHSSDSYDHKRHCHKRRGTKYVKKDTSGNDKCFKKGTRENPFSSLLEAELDGKWKKLVVLASVPCYGPLDGGLKLEDGQKLVGEGADPKAVGYVKKAWITNTTDRLDGSVLVTEGDNEVSNLLIGEEGKEIKGDAIINANKAGNLSLCNLKIVEDSENQEEKSVLTVTDNDKDGSIVLNCVESIVRRADGVDLITKGKSNKYLCIFNTKFQGLFQEAIRVIAEEESEISVRLDKLEFTRGEFGVVPETGIFLGTEEEGTISDVFINESSIFSLNAVRYQPGFPIKCDKRKGKIIITKSVTGTVFIGPGGEADVLAVLKDNKILSGTRVSSLQLSPGKDIVLKGSVKRNVISGRQVILDGDGEMDLKMYDNKITTYLEIGDSENLKLRVKAQNNTISVSNPEFVAIFVRELDNEPVLDFGCGELGSKGHNSILVVDPLVASNAIVNSNGFVARKNWWGENGPVVETGPGVTVDVSDPLSEAPQQFCDC